MPYDETKFVCLSKPFEDEPFFRFQSDAMLGRLSEAILSLPERERLVFTLYYYEELTTGEIELLLGKTEPSVSQIHASTLLHLRTLLWDTLGHT